MTPTSLKVLLAAGVVPVSLPTCPWPRAWAMAALIGAAVCWLATGGARLVLSSDSGMCKTQNTRPPAAKIQTAAVASAKTVLTEGRGGEIGCIGRL